MENKKCLKPPTRWKLKQHGGLMAAEIWRRKLTKTSTLQSRPCRRAWEKHGFLRSLCALLAPKVLRNVPRRRISDEAEVPGDQEAALKSGMSRQSSTCKRFLGMATLEVFPGLNNHPTKVTNNHEVSGFIHHLGVLRFTGWHWLVKSHQHGMSI